MKHDVAVLLVPDLVKGALSGDERVRVGEHLAGCEECRAHMTACGDLSTILGRGERRGGSHPPSEEIVTLALSRDDLTRPQATSLDAHVAGCPPCRSEIERIRAADSGIREGGGGGTTVAARRFVSTPRSAFVAPLAAAAIIVLLSGVPLYLMYERTRDQALRLEGMERESSRSSTELLDDRRSGPVALNLLRPGSRGADGVTRVVVGPADRSVLLTIEPELPRAPSAEIRIELRRADGRAVWSFRSTLARLKPLIDASDGVLPLRVPVSGLAPGPYELVESASGPEALLRIRFEIVRP